MPSNVIPSTTPTSERTGRNVVRSVRPADLGQNFVAIVPCRTEFQLRHTRSVVETRRSRDVRPYDRSLPRATDLLESRELVDDPQATTANLERLGSSSSREWILQPSVVGHLAHDRVRGGPHSNGSSPPAISDAVENQLTGDGLK